MLNLIVSLILIFVVALAGPACAGSGVQHGAIRWDAFYTNGATDPGRYTANILSPAKWQYRAPLHASIDGPNLLHWAPTQATMDAEITAAHNGGLAYWAYLTYGTNIVDLTNPMMQALVLHRSSSIKANMNYTLMVQTGNLGTTSSYAAAVSAVDTLTKDSNWEHVSISGVSRPLIYIYYSAGDVTNYFGGSNSNVATVLSALRTAIELHDNNPYIVVMATPTIAAAVGGDGFATYACCGATMAQEPWATFEPTIEAYWASQVAGASSTLGAVPAWMSGWQNTARVERPPSWESSTRYPRIGSLNSVTPPTNAQLVAMFIDLNTFVKANTTTVPCQCTLGYSWSECDEGDNCLMPTLGDPTGSKLTAISSTIAP